MTTGARAIIAAQAARLNGSTKSGTARETEVHKNRLTEAGLVLDWEPALASEVIAGLTPLSKAVERARERKQESEQAKAKTGRLNADAPDLLALVNEGRMGIGVAHLDRCQ